MWRSTTLPYEWPLWQIQRSLLARTSSHVQVVPLLLTSQVLSMGILNTHQIQPKVFRHSSQTNFSCYLNTSAKLLNHPHFRFQLWSMMLIGVFEEHIGSYVVHILPLIRLGNFDMAPGSTQPYCQLLFLHRVCSIKKRHSRDGCSWLHLCRNFLDITSIELLLLATSSVNSSTAIIV
jgi:hypothetical protein